MMELGEEFLKVEQRLNEINNEIRISFQACFDSVDWVDVDFYDRRENAENLGFRVLGEMNCESVSNVQSLQREAKELEKIKDKWFGRFYYWL